MTCAAGGAIFFHGRVRIPGRAAGQTGVHDRCCGVVGVSWNFPHNYGATTSFPSVAAVAAAAAAPSPLMLVLLLLLLLLAVTSAP